MKFEGAKDGHLGEKLAWDYIVGFPALLIQIKMYIYIYEELTRRKETVSNKLENS